MLYGEGSGTLRATGERSQGGQRSRGHSVARRESATHLSQASQEEMTGRRRSKMLIDDRRRLTASQRFLENFTF